MARHSTITIPSNLLPADGRFGSGPSKVLTAFVDRLAATGPELVGTSHRRDTVRAVISNIRNQLAALYELPDGYEVILGVGGATAFWDAAVHGLIERRSAHFVCGEFSAKFAAAAGAAPHLESPAIIDAPAGSAPTPVAVPDTDTVAFIHNETSTGVMAPFGRVGEQIVAVDGTSAAGAIPFDPTGVDVYYFSPQKALGSEGGLWLALCSPAALARIAAMAGSDRWIPAFLNLQTAIDNSRQNQTYNTPALMTLSLLSQQLDHVVSLGGLAWAHGRSLDSAGRLAAWVDESEYASPFVTDPALRSPTVTTIDFTSSVNADAVAAVLRTNGIVDTESYRKLGRNQLRIATFPNIDPEDITALTVCIDWVVEALAES